jgi:hypothetical protein
VEVLVAEVEELGGEFYAGCWEVSVEWIEWDGTTYDLLLQLQN